MSNDDTTPIIFERTEASRLADLLVEYYPGDAGWRVLSRHLADAYVESEATHYYRSGYEAKRKSRYERSENRRVLHAIAEIVADWPERPLRYITNPTTDNVLRKVAEIARGLTSRQMELDEAAAQERERAELSRRIDESMRELYAPKAAE